MQNIHAFGGHNNIPVKDMASPDQVKQYLAYWLQLGKRVIMRGGEEVVCLSSVIVGDRYSDEFEACWQRLLLPESGDCYLEGTVQTIAELLGSRWEISPCARCDMPVPMIVLGQSPNSCPCNDIPLWPNNDLPKPRSPVDNQRQLQRIHDRLNAPSPDSESEPIN